MSAVATAVLAGWLTFVTVTALAAMALAVMAWRR